MTAVKKQDIHNAPATPGVYIFRRGTTPLYIGKAVHLKKRLSSYFRAVVSEKVRRLRAEADHVEWHLADSEIDALIQEAALIKTHLPKFNVLMRDDKNYFYVVITKGIFPRIFLTHQPHMSAGTYLGPFTSGRPLRDSLKLLRRIFPYCTCTQAHTRPCLNAQIGRCLGYCCLKNTTPNHADVAEYAHHIRAIIRVLSGTRKKLVSEIRRAMRSASAVQQYERAARLRDQMTGLMQVFSHHATHAPVITTRGVAWRVIEKTIQRLCGHTRPITRVEGYDISNISGTEATGSMVVFIRGKAVKSEYRKFRIKTVAGANDVAGHREVMRRRLTHKGWPVPDLFVVDGGKPQFNAVLAVSRELFRHERTFAITALAKQNEELYTEARKMPILLASLPKEVMFFFQRVRDESHRFAKAYHHVLRAKKFIPYEIHLNNRIIMHKVSKSIIKSNHMIPTEIRSISYFVTGLFRTG